VELLRTAQGQRALATGTRQWRGTRSRAHHRCGAQAVQRPSKVQKLIPDGQVEVASGDWVGIALISCTSITPLPPVGVVTVS
jgi:hypothetical protein